MLYSEFIENTGCKENEYNYQIYKRLELMYMADDSISKQEIYEYGKKLVDNSKSEAEVEIENKMKAEIAYHKHEIELYKQELENQKRLLSEEIGDKLYRKDRIRYFKDCIKTERREIEKCKFVLGV